MIKRNKSCQYLTRKGCGEIKLESNFVHDSGKCNLCVNSKDYRFDKKLTTIRRSIEDRKSSTDLGHSLDSIVI